MRECLRYACNWLLKRIKFSCNPEKRLGRNKTKGRLLDRNYRVTTVFRVLMERRGEENKMFWYQSDVKTKKRLDSLFFSCFGYR